MKPWENLGWRITTCWYLLGTVTFLVCLFAGNLSANAGTVEILVKTGETIGGKTLINTLFPKLNNKGDVVFNGQFSATPKALIGIFTPDSILVQPGDTIGGQTLDSVSSPFINDNGTLHFEDSLMGSTAMAFSYWTRSLRSQAIPLEGKL